MYQTTSRPSQERGAYRVGRRWRRWWRLSTRGRSLSTHRGGAPPTGLPPAPRFEPVQVRAGAPAHAARVQLRLQLGCLFVAQSRGVQGRTAHAEHRHRLRLASLPLLERLRFLSVRPHPIRSCHLPRPWASNLGTDLTWDVTGSTDHRLPSRSAGASWPYAPSECFVQSETRRALLQRRRGRERAGDSKAKRETRAPPSATNRRGPRATWGERLVDERLSASACVCVCACQFPLGWSVFTSKPHRQLRTNGWGWHRPSGPEWVAMGLDRGHVGTEELGAEPRPAASMGACRPPWDGRGMDRHSLRERVAGGSFAPRAVPSSGCISRGGLAQAPAQCSSRQRERERERDRASERERERERATVVL